jgi:hypothetical protein
LPPFDTFNIDFPLLLQKERTAARIELQHIEAAALPLQPHDF